MVKIRLKRLGAKKKPSYRVVVADARAPRDGSVIDTIGHYDPMTDPATVVINGERALHWLSHGAQPTDTVAKLLFKAGIIETPVKTSNVARGKGPAEQTTEETT